MDNNKDYYKEYYKKNKKKFKEYYNKNRESIKKDEEINIEIKNKPITIFFN